MTEETKGKLASIWEAIRVWSYKYIGALFMIDKGDGRKDISLSRVVFMLLMGYMFYFWQTWVSVITITPEAIALAIQAKLPEGSQISGVDILAASQKIVNSIPNSEPPLLKVVFLTMAGAVFGDKVLGIARTKLNGNGEE